MEQLSEMAQVNRELKQARHSLRETFEQVNHKVAQVRAHLQPRAIMRGNPVALPLLAGLFALMTGSDRQLRPLRWIAIGAVMGAALTAAHRGNNNGSNGTRQ
jgi:hypothetical protein